MKKMILTLLLVVAAWLSQPTTSGWYWLKTPGGDTIMSYIDTKDKIITICDPDTAQCVRSTLDNVKPEIKYQGPIKAQGAGKEI